jgi:cyclic di-GMP phosphodiesterase Gmr
MVRAAVTLGHAMELQVVAEGISCAEEEVIAIKAGCDGLQGYLYAQPMPADELEAYLAQLNDGRISNAA